jgi:hypothetical protein
MQFGFQATNSSTSTLTSVASPEHAEWELENSFFFSFKSLNNLFKFLKNRFLPFSNLKDKF